MLPTTSIQSEVRDMLRGGFPHRRLNCCSLTYELLVTDAVVLVLYVAFSHSSR